MKHAQTIFAPSDDGTKSPNPVVVSVITEKYTQSSGRQPSCMILNKAVFSMLEKLSGTFCVVTKLRTHLKPENK
jgi:hypothetical protein